LITAQQGDALNCLGLLVASATRLMSLHRVIMKAGGIAKAKLDVSDMDGLLLRARVKASISNYNYKSEDSRSFVVFKSSVS